MSLSREEKEAGYKAIQQPPEFQAIGERVRGGEPPPADGYFGGKT